MLILSLTVDHADFQLLTIGTFYNFARQLNEGLFLKHVAQSELTEKLSVTSCRLMFLRKHPTIRIALKPAVVSVDRISERALTVEHSAALTVDPMAVAVVTTESMGANSLPEVSEVDSNRPCSLLGPPLPGSGSSHPSSSCRILLTPLSRIPHPSPRHSVLGTHPIVSEGEKRIELSLPLSLSLFLSLSLC